MKAFIFSFFMLFVGLSMAQNQKVVFINFPVAALELKNPAHILSDKNIYLAEIELNGDFTFEEKASGKVFSLSENAEKGKNNFIGTANPQRIKANRMNLKIVTEKGIALSIGDLVQLPVIVSNEPNSLTFDLFRFHINLLNSYNDKIFDCETWGSYLVENEDVLLKKLADEVRYYGGEMRGKMPSFTLTAGNYKDMDMFDAMIRTSTEDMRNFLNFVRTYPLHYAGQDWKIAEIYATWLANDTPKGK